jgi:hypothetical protein
MGGGNTAMSGIGGMGGGSAMGANAAAQQSFMQMQLMQQQNMMALQQMMMQVNMRPPDPSMMSGYGPSGMGGMGHYPGSVMSGHPSMMQGGPMGVCSSRLPDIVACVTSLVKLQIAM